VRPIRFSISKKSLTSGALGPHTSATISAIPAPRPPATAPSKPLTIVFYKKIKDLLYKKCAAYT
jgi:hypothetical protein